MKGKGDIPKQAHGPNTLQLHWSFFISLLGTKRICSLTKSLLPLQVDVCICTHTNTHCGLIFPVFSHKFHFSWSQDAVRSIFSPFIYIFSLTTIPPAPRGRWAEGKKKKKQRLVWETEDRGRGGKTEPGDHGEKKVGGSSAKWSEDGAIWWRASWLLAFHLSRQEFLSGFISALLSANSRIFFYPDI